MKKIKLFFCLAVFMLVLGINSCKKDETRSSTSNSFIALTSISQLSASQKVQSQEMFTWFNANLQASGLQPFWDKAVQTIHNGSHVIEVPTSSDAALFFTKVNGNLNVYAYKWLDKAPGAQTFTGNVIYYSFQDNTINASVYTKSKMIKTSSFNAAPSGFSFSSIGNKALNLNVSNNTLAGALPISKQKNLDGPATWLAWLGCVLSGGSWMDGYGAGGCNVFDGSGGSFWSNLMSFFNTTFGGSGGGGDTSSGSGDSSGSSDGSGTSDGNGGGTFTYADGSSISTSDISSGEMVWITVNPPPCDPTGGTQSFNPDGSGVVDPCSGGPSSTSTWVSVPELINEPTGSNLGMTIDQGDADEDNNQDGAFDNTIYPDYDQSQPWPKVANVLHGATYIKYDGSNCLDLAKRQIAPLQISNYGAPGQTINAYTEAGGANLANVKSAVVYINSELSNNRPVIVGVDVKPGQKPPYTDNSTDHFIVIVGSGTDNKGNYYRFYDNSTDDPNYGASAGNKLYYNPLTGIISGNTTTRYDNTDTQAIPANVSQGVHPYILTQVRKNKKP